MDSIKQYLTDHAFAWEFEALAPGAIHAAKAEIIDTLGTIVGGFSGEPCRIARQMAARMPQSDGATVIGTRIRTSPDMAAFVNGTAARCGDGNYRGTSAHPRPGDTAAPVLAAAEHAQADGRGLIAAMALANDVYRRLSDVFENSAVFCQSNIACVATALAAGKLLGLSRPQLEQCISLSAVSSVTLNQVRDNAPSMWDQFAAGHAGRAGLFAALAAREGMEGPVLPFEGKSGWCDNVAGTRFMLDEDLGNTTGRPTENTELLDVDQVEAGFHALTQGVLGSKQARAVLDCLWNLERLDNVAVVPAAVVVD